MPLSPDVNPFEQIVHKFAPDSQLIESKLLSGGVSAQVTLLKIRQPDGRYKKLVVRQYGDNDLRSNPSIARDEYQLLETLYTAGIIVPQPYFYDDSGDILPKPYLVIEHIDGHVEFTSVDTLSCIQQLASQLAQIHGVNIGELSFLYQYTERIPQRLQNTREKFIQEALHQLMTLPQTNAPSLLHGDYWLGNVLWNDNRIVGVIDWEDAAIGDPLADLANSRLEILWAFGQEAMRQFTQAYENVSGVDVTNLPYWDLATASRKPIDDFDKWAAGWSAYGRDDMTGDKMREGHRWFITQALGPLNMP